MNRVLSERVKQSLAFVLVAVSGMMLIAVGIRDSNLAIAFAGLVLAVTAMGLLGYTLRES